MIKPGPRKKPCKFHLAGFCRHAQACSYLHPKVPVPVPAPTPPVRQPKSGRPSRLDFYERMICLSVVRNLGRLFQGDEAVARELGLVEQLFRCGRAEEGQQLLAQLMTKPERSEEQVQGYKTIRLNAQILYQHVYEQLVKQ